MREWRPEEMNPGDFHTFDVSAQFLFVGCSDGRVLRLELETGEERYSNDLGGGGVQEIVISRSGETFAAVCDDRWSTATRKSVQLREHEFQQLRR